MAKWVIVEGAGGSPMRVILLRSEVGRTGRVAVVVATRVWGGKTRWASLRM